jgi:hypothetical protein
MVLQFLEVEMKAPVVAVFVAALGVPVAANAQSAGARG